MIVLQRLVFLCLLAFLTAGCGQKGPLYLEGHEPPSQRVPGAKKPAPAESEEPAPAEKKQEEQR
jgi:predicted small lipoprotein YifL